MKILIFLFLLFGQICCISLWQAKLVSQEAQAVAEAPHPIIRSDAEASAPKVVVTQNGRIFVVRGAETEGKKTPTRLELLAKRRIERITNGARRSS